MSQASVKQTAGHKLTSFKEKRTIQKKVESIDRARELACLVLLDLCFYPLQILL